jgi:hypothetical protein
VVVLEVNRTSESRSEELIIYTDDTTYLRAGVRNCHLREDKYATYTKGAWSVHTVSVGHRCGSVSAMTVSK